MWCKKLSSRILSIGRVSVIAMLSTLLFACSESEQQTEVPLRPIRSIIIGQDLINSTKTFSGVSRSAQESRLSFKVAGTVSEIPVTVGDSIKAGSVIARLDSSTYELQRQQAQATVEQSRAAARNARAAYERTRSLYANNNVSLGELESARANSESASAQLQAANKSLQLADLNASYTALTVDVDCVLDSVSIEENENVQVGTEVARVNCSDELEVEVAVPESIISDFQRGKPAEIQFDAIRDISFKGTVVELGVDAGGVGSTFPVTVLINQQHPSLRSGLAASVSFNTADVDVDNFLLPLSAVVRRSTGTYVYLVNPIVSTDETNKFIGEVSLRQVELGELQTGGVEVISGLGRGDRVVVAGVSFLREGLQVLY